MNTLEIAVQNFCLLDLKSPTFKKKKKSSVLRTPIFEVSQDYSLTLQLILYINILYAFFLYIRNKKNSFKKMLPTCSKTEKENAFKFHSAIFMLH